jgi:hypothetical protein
LFINRLNWKYTNGEIFEKNFGKKGPSILETSICEAAKTFSSFKIIAA